MVLHMIPELVQGYVHLDMLNIKTMDDLDAMNLAYENWVPEGCAPARACGRSEMASEELLVEFTVTAAI